MNNIVYFITCEYIKKYYSGYLDQNIDDDALSSFILVAQDTRIQELLGYDLYNYYITNIYTNGTPGDSNHTILFENFIQKSAALWALYEAYPSLTFKLTNKALSTKSSEYSQPASRNDVEYVRNEIMKAAQFYDARCASYIKTNPSQFPEYFTVSGVERIKHKNNLYFGGLYLPDNLPYGGGTPFKGDDRCCDGRGSYLNW